MGKSTPPSPEAPATTAVEIRCAPQYSVLSLIRLFISNLAHEMGFNEEAVSEIELCVDEACANVIDHAYDEGAPVDRSRGIVGIQISITPETLTIAISDNGVGPRGNFGSGVTDLDEYQARERPRGLGLYIIRKLMDEVSVDFPGEQGTRLTMMKRLPSRAGT